MTYLWGIDLGGTKIEGIVLSDKDHRTLSRIRVDTEAQNGYETILSNINKLVLRLREESKSDPKIIGFGTPGIIDPETDLLKNSNTLCLNGKPLLKDLEKLLGIEVRTANDANCFALAEATLGAGKGAQCCFGIILGTGVGGGIVLDGKVRSGTQGIAGEWGHNVLDPSGEECYCGKRGCVEKFISGPALQKFYSKLTGKELKLSEILKLYEEKEDVAAKETIERLVRNFGLAVSTVINILDPDVIVLGGGVSNIPYLYTEGLEEVKKNVFNNKLTTKIVKNELGDSAGVFGAAALTL